MAADGQAELFFATPILVDRLADAAAINAALAPLVMARRGADPGLTRSNVGSWHSGTDLLQWAAEAVRPAVARAVALADANTRDLEARPGERRGWLLEAWANVTEAGGSNAAHHHGGCYWSAVYYVQIDPEAAGGELFFEDPRGPRLDMHAPSLRFRDAGGEQLVSMRPEAGTLVLFPSWLVHRVAPWQGREPRISIAINLTAPPLRR
ncbi:MAG: 2OG-Fe(II) oxygenase family protein [Alphaproteobacteria bacterium]|nr:2OG-Fe(II) oxygenase family protein [Alphaproteobacteria bacterium]